jgi:hypothetical protein
MHSYARPGEFLFHISVNNLFHDSVHLPPALVISRGILSSQNVSEGFRKTNRHNRVWKRINA